MTLVDKPRRRSTRTSKRAGMGANLYRTGTTFRVWAPHAQHVFVAGEFNDWSPDANPLASEKNGYWSADVPHAKATQQYQYRIINSEQELWRNDPYAREVTNSAGKSIIHDPAFDWQDDDFRAPNWNEMVIYEMHIGTFAVDPEVGIGTFDKAAERLPYLRDLGVNVVQVMPPMEFPGDLSWGYNPSYPFAVESIYGGPQAFKRFIKAAHQHKIAVVLDVVYNHFGPSDLDLWRFDGWSENGMGGIYFYNDWRANTPWGDTRPDYGRAEVRQYIRDHALFWIEEYRVDGLRFDATNYIRNVRSNQNPQDDLPDGWSLLRWVNEEIDARYPWKITIAEDLQSNPYLTEVPDRSGAGFDAQWDAGFVHPVREALITQEDAHRNMNAVVSAIQNRYNDNAFKRVVYTESHDEVANGKARVPEEIAPEHADNWFAKKRSTLGAAMVFTTPGIPMIFQGQEILEDAWFDDRHPLDWQRAETFSGVAQLYADLFKLRRNVHGTTSGLTGQHLQVHHVNSEGKVIAYHRWYEQGGPLESTLVVLSLTHQRYEDYRIGFPAEGRWVVRFNSDSKRYDGEFGNDGVAEVIAEHVPYDGMPFSAVLRIPAYSALILSQDA